MVRLPSWLVRLLRLDDGLGSARFQRAPNSFVTSPVFSHAPQERVSAMWSLCHHLNEETSRFSLSYLRVGHIGLATFASAVPIITVCRFHAFV